MHLDNCKFFLMCVVVFNHCFQDYFEHVLDPATGRGWCGSDASWFFRFARGAYLYLSRSSPASWDASASRACPLVRWRTSSTQW